jgi:hypothetical protein
MNKKRSFPNENSLIQRDFKSKPLKRIIAIFKKTRNYCILQKTAKFIISTQIP